MKLVKGEPKDAKDLKKIHVSAYQTSYRGYIPDDYLDSLSVSDDVVERTARFIEANECYLIEVDNEKVAFVYLAYPEDRKDTFEIQAIYVHPDCQRKGVGRFFVNELAQMKKKEGFQKVIAWTIKEALQSDFMKKRGFIKLKVKINFGDLISLLFVLKKKSKSFFNDLCCEFVCMLIKQ